MAPQAFVAEVVLEAWNSASPFLALVLAAVPLQLPFFFDVDSFSNAFSLLCNLLKSCLVVEREASNLERLPWFPAVFVNAVINAACISSA